MQNLGRRKFLKDTSLIAGFSIVAAVPAIAGFPQLFPVVLAANDPPKTSKKSKKTVSPSKPTKPTKPAKPTKPTKPTRK